MFRSLLRNTRPNVLSSSRLLLIRSTRLYATKTATATKATQTTTGRSKTTGSATTKTTKAKATKKTPAKTKAKGRKKTTKPKAKAKPKPRKKKVAVKKESITDVYSQIKFGPPKPKTPYIIFISERMKSADKFKNLDEASKAIKEYSSEWNSLTEDEKEDYKQLFREGQAAYLKDYALFLSDMTPGELYKQNQLRSRYNRLRTALLKENETATTKKRIPTASALSPLKDSRLPTRPISPFLRFATSQYDAFQGTLIEQVKVNAQRWKSMSDSEKKPYTDGYETELQEYKAAVSKLKE